MRSILINLWQRVPFRTCFSIFLIGNCSFNRYYLFSSQNSSSIQFLKRFLRQARKAMINFQQVSEFFYVNKLPANLTRPIKIKVNALLSSDPLPRRITRQLTQLFPPQVNWNKSNFFFFLHNLFYDRIPFDFNRLLLFCGAFNTWVHSIRSNWYPSSSSPLLCCEKGEWLPISANNSQ